MTRMYQRILVSSALLFAGCFWQAPSACAASNGSAETFLAEIRSGIAGLPSSEGLLQTARSGAPAACIAKISDYIKDNPRRPAPWDALTAQAVCALCAKDRRAALQFADTGLSLRGSNSDLLVVKALILDLPLPDSEQPNSQRPIVTTTSAPHEPKPVTPAELKAQALTEAIVFNRFEHVSRLKTLILLGHTLNDLGQTARAANLISRFVAREPGARAMLVETFMRAGNRAKALSLSQEYLTATPKEADILRARVRALLGATDRVLNRADFQEALELMQDLPTALGFPDLMLKGQILLMLNRPQEALKILTSVPSELLESDESKAALKALKDQAMDEVQSAK